jgi:hypothetical protein
MPKRQAENKMGARSDRLCKVLAYHKANLGSPDGDRHNAVVVDVVQKNLRSAMLARTSTKCVARAK